MENENMQLPISNENEESEIEKYNKYDLLKYELFEQLLPRLLYTLSEEQKKVFLEEIEAEAGNMVYELFKRLCDEDGIDCPYCEDDFPAEAVHEGGLSFISVAIPESEFQVNQVLRVYFLTAHERQNHEKQHTRYFYIKKFIDKGMVHVMYISPKEEPMLGDELTNHMDDRAYERRALARNFMIILMDEFHPEEIMNYKID